MIKNWFTTSNIDDTHPSEESLLKYVDGELTTKESASVRLHLEICWNCRLQLEKIEETISAFIEFRQQIMTPLTPKPPNNWSSFDRKLNELATASPSISKSWWTRSIGSLSRFFQKSTGISEWSPPLKQTFIGSVAAVLIAVIFWQFVLLRPVTAAELLEKSTRAERKNLLSVNQPVVYQKLRVRHQGSVQSDWELWRDTTHLRYRHNVSDEINEQIDQELWSILQANGFNPQQPLSAATFSGWSKSLVEKKDTVEQEQTDGGDPLLILRTINLAANSVGKISEGVLRVRESDFHPVGQTLHITTANGIETYEFTELDYRILSLTAFEPGFFPEPDRPEMTSVIPDVSSSQPAETNANSNSALESAVREKTDSNKAAERIDIPKVTASADLEVEVLDLLNKAKADLGEQITAKRESDGLLYVRGIVETEGRKNEILKALQAVENNPAVRIEIKTVAEAVAELKNAPQPSGTAEVFENQSSVTAAESELLAYFESEKAAREFGGQMIARSNRAMSRAFALKRIVGQFDPEELRRLSPAARAKWLALVRSHARAFREETESLRAKLQPVFDAPNVSASTSLEVNDVTDVPGAVALLLDFASTNDQVVRSAFTLSSGNTRFTAIKTAQFWRSLKNAEAIAAKLQSVK